MRLYGIEIDGKPFSKYTASQSPIGNPPVFLVSVDNFPWIGTMGNPVDYRQNYEEADKLAYELAKKFVDSTAKGLDKIVDNTKHSNATYINF